MNDIAVERIETPTPDARALVGELEGILSAEYPPEQRHGLPFEAIFQPHIQFFVASLDGVAAGCGGVALFPQFAEVKRMYVRPVARGRGVAQALLARIEAASAGLAWLRLETGPQQKAAIAMYGRWGFEPCGTFGAYAGMPAEQVAASVFMQKRLTG